MNKLIQRRISKGYNPAQSESMLAELLAAHTGDNLAFALAYNDFATESQAYKFIASIA